MTSSLALTLFTAASLLLGTAHADCKVVHKATSGDDLLLQGTILTPRGPLYNGQLLIQSGTIAGIGHANTSTGLRGLWKKKKPTVIDCTDGSSVISPGFINAHEHIAYSTINPFEATGELYNHRHDWRVGLRGHAMREANVNGSDLDAIKWGELRHLFSGTTSIVGGDMVSGLTRNLDFVAGLEDGLRPPLDTFDIFPLDDATGIIRNGDCDYGPDAIDQDFAGQHFRYLAHVGEGVDAEAANEFQCLSNLTYDTTPMSEGGGLSTDVIYANFVLLHALGLSEADFDVVARRGAQVVWSPRSNVFLYGKTLDVDYLLRAGITVALGTDWLPSGSATMGREAVCALSATQTQFQHGLEPKTLWEMMTINAAKVAGFESSLGSLEVGKLADIVIFSGASTTPSQSSGPYAQAIYAPEEDVELVLRGGKVMVASDALKATAANSSACEPLQFGPALKTVCVQEELNMTFAAFETALNGVYSAVLPGIPADEPPCVPSR